MAIQHTPVYLPPDNAHMVFVASYPRTVVLEMCDPLKNWILFFSIQGQEEGLGKLLLLVANPQTMLSTDYEKTVI